LKNDLVLTQQNSQAKAHTNSKKQRSSETQNIENDKKGESSGDSPPHLFAWKESCCLNNKKVV